MTEASTPNGGHHTTAGMTEPTTDRGLRTDCGTASAALLCFNGTMSSLRTME